MNNQSTFVKIVIWLMVFLMSVGFAALVISPFAGGSLFGDSSGREATQELVDEARAKVEKHDCANEDVKLTGERLADCKDALRQLAAAYTTLAQPEEGATEPPRDYQRNIDRAGDAYQRLHQIDENDEEGTAQYAGYLRDYTNKTQESLDLWTILVKRHPKKEDYLLNQAGSYQTLGNLDQAIATLQTYLRRFPDSGRVSSIEDEIASLRKQKKEQASGGGLNPTITTS